MKDRLSGIPYKNRCYPFWGFLPVVGGTKTKEKPVRKKIKIPILSRYRTYQQQLKLTKETIAASRHNNPIAESLSEETKAHLEKLVQSLNTTDAPISIEEALNSGMIHVSAKSKIPEDCTEELVKNIASWCTSTRDIHQYISAIKNCYNITRK